MPSADDASSTRPNGSSSRSDQLAYYKAQYEQLEAELSDFQASSRELEAELEKDIEASEKRERVLKEKLEILRYEVDEWKSKFKQSKSEASSAQNTLQKEITTLRDTNRTLQLKLRDTEVANDDYERQARHTTSSLEDLEQKYNMAIERGVLLEDELKAGDKERESLRISNQRLRDELSEQKLETEIVQEKLRHELYGGRRKKPTPLYRTTPTTPQTPEIFDRSPGTSTVSSPMFATPPIKSSLMVNTMATTATPPSPPMSETSSSVRRSVTNITPAPPVSAPPMAETPTSVRRSATAGSGFPLQKAAGSESLLGSRTMYSSKTSKFSQSRNTSSYAQGNKPRTNLAKPSTTNATAPTSSSNGNGNANGNTSTNGTTQNTGLPKSGSLFQIRGLIGKMQKLEERVHSAKSKLPAPSDSPSRGSSRSGSISVAGGSPVASTITMRRNSRKRLSGSSFSSSVREGDGASSYASNNRPSFGNRTQGDSRPSSRTSYSSSSFSQSTHPSVTPSTRPESRQSRTKTPLGHYSMNPTTESRRPRSSLSNPSGQNGQVNGMSNIDEDEDLAFRMSVRAKISEARETRFPSYSTPTGLKKRTPSGISAIPAPRSFRTSTGLERREGTVGSPDPKDLGETF
ncbi:nuclear distribution protein nude [Aspergillus heteromorphus CBS 117.55]|uniref:Nuclear distribution protein nude n=1 Tax=Aspergillus heteromorphus CBS 117.55 TaxID=1448321 RepID=A0A317VBW3_9EURO|nr:nuclear distribution protein nude [Aspergillus heteromorphus CBS 117.55]PWY70488.1 nuclear distribution protein nude [Aspergillus heteromorphus CBS 117.55]